MSLESGAARASILYNRIPFIQLYSIHSWPILLHGRYTLLSLVSCLIVYLYIYTAISCPDIKAHGNRRQGGFLDPKVGVVRFSTSRKRYLKSTNRQNKKKPFYPGVDPSPCKGVRCPSIFSLSNLINVGWL